MFNKIKYRLLLKYLAFKRKPLLFLRYFCLLIFFRFLGVIICLFFTVLPLPISNFIQHLMNINLSFNSFKDIWQSVRQVAHSFTNIFPSYNDITKFLKSLLTNFSPNNLFNILRQIPSDLRQFFLQFMEHLRQRLKDIRLFLKSLYPINQALKRFKLFLYRNTHILKRLLKNFLMMFFSLICLKVLFWIIIPFLGISAIYFIGFDVSLIIIALLSLLTSQLGNLLGKAINTLLINLYDKFHQHHTNSKVNIILFLFALFYTKFAKLLNKLRLQLNFYVNYLLKKLCIFFIAIYYYYKIKNTKI